MNVIEKRPNIELAEFLLPEEIVEYFVVWQLLFKRQNKRHLTRYWQL